MMNQQRYFYSPEVYTDGACENNGQLGAKGGIGVYWGPNDKRNVSEALHGRQTNNRAEIQAAVRALCQAQEQRLEAITIRSDSTLLIKGMNRWIDNWLQNGWRKANGEPVENRADFENIIEVSEGIEVDWEYVPAHCGNVGNEAADRLAKEGIKIKKHSVRRNIRDILYFPGDCDPGLESFDFGVIKK